MAVVADFVGSIGLVTEQLYPFRTMRLMAAGAGMPSIAPFLVLGPGKGMSLSRNPRAGMRLFENALMAIFAENVNRLPEEFPVPCRMSLVAFHALAVLDRRMNHRPYVLGFPMTVQAEGRHCHIKQLIVIRLMRLVTLHAHTLVCWAMFVPFSELLTVMAFGAEIWHVGVEQLTCNRGVRVMACGAQAFFNGRVYYPLAGETLLAMTIEANVI